MAGYGYHEDADKNIILQTWLLSENEVVDPVHTSPHEMMKLVRSIPEAVLIERYNKLMSSIVEKLSADLLRYRYRASATAKMLGWEKPIPQVG